jgi:hypothetical protein
MDDGPKTESGITIEDGIIYISTLYLQDPKAAAILAQYPQARWSEMTRRALKIGLHYLKGGVDE